MARKPPDWQQPSLFPPDSVITPEPQDNATYESEGDQNAVQDNRSLTPASMAGDSRGAAKSPQATADAGPLRSGAEEGPRSLDGPHKAAIAATVG